MKVIWASKAPLHEEREREKQRKEAHGEHMRREKIWSAWPLRKREHVTKGGTVRQHEMYSMFCTFPAWN